MFVLRLKESRKTYRSIGRKISWANRGGHSWKSAVRVSPGILAAKRSSTQVWAEFASKASKLKWKKSPDKAGTRIFRVFKPFQDGAKNVASVAEAGADA